MFTNASFGKFLYELRPQTNSARMTLYNYIRNFSDLNSPFSPDTIHKFYFKALSFEHWQKNNLELAQEIRLILEKVKKFTSDFQEFQRIKHSDEIQVIRIVNKRDQLEMLHSYFKTKKLNFNFKIYSDKGNTSHAILIFPHGPVHVYSFDDQAAIVNGQLKPLCLDQKLEYTSQLNLTEGCVQAVQISQYVGTRFQIRTDKISGEYLRGYTLQAYKKFEAYSLQEELQILYAIKKIERFFIDRATEPLYMELIQILEQTSEFLKKNHPGSVELAQKAYVRGQNALENLFIDDKMIPILLNDIQELLKEKGKDIQWNNSSESINSYHKQELQAEEPQTNL